MPRLDVLPPSPFDLPDRLAAKRAPALIATDERHFSALSRHLDSTVADLSERLAAELRAPGGGGQRALDRDQEVRRLEARLRALRRYGLDVCLGRMVLDGATEPVYVGRLGLADPTGERLLVDWRSPAAAPFFRATTAEPLGLVSRRRYRWTRGRITDYWDEALVPGADVAGGALDDQSAFLASLAGERTARMRDVLGTIQADQDAIIRADARGALVVDGGPGTGKTVVALHRAAYLLYSDPRMSRRHGGVLVVGPSPAYLDYVADVLPSLGEEGVRLATLPELVREGVDAVPEQDGRVAALKGSPELVRAVERAVRWFERPPSDPLRIETDWVDVDIEPEDWSRAVEAAEPGVPHDDAREEVWAELLRVVAERAADGEPVEPVRRALAQSPDLRAAFATAWPVLDPAGVIADLWSSPGWLRRCAPGLADEEVLLLQRADPRAWTDADLPLLDAARRRIGDPEEVRR